MFVFRLLLLTSRNQRCGIHDPGDGPQIIWRHVGCERQLHVRIPGRDDGIGIHLEVDRAVFLSGLFLLALDAHTRPELAKRQPVLDIAFKVAVDLKQIICSPSASSSKTNKDTKYKSA